MSLPTYDFCAVCGRYKRILGRGACAADYQAYRRAKRLDELPRGKVGRPVGYRPTRRKATS